jgi:predicted nuclease with TOPRIM domain
MNVAPDWAKVILSVIRSDIKSLGQVTANLINSNKFTDVRINNLEKANTKLRTEVTKHQQDLDSLNLRFAKMESAYKGLEERVIRQEVQARKPNLLFCGIPEDNRDTWRESRIKVDHIMLQMGLAADPRQIKVDKVHRLGPPPPRGHYANVRP